MIVVDYQLAFTRGPLAGDYPEAALQATARIASAARALGAPVAYSYCAYEPDLSDAGPFGVKCPGLAACERGSEGCDIDPARDALPAATSCSRSSSPRRSSARLCTSACARAASTP